MSSTHLDGSGSLNIIRQRSIESKSEVVRDPITERRASLPGSGIHVLHDAPPSSLNPSDTEQAPSPPPPIGGKAKYAGVGGLTGGAVAGLGVGIGVAIAKGALIGGAVGTALGPVGTVIGAVVGGLIAGAVIGLGVRWGRKPSANPQPLPPVSHNPAPSLNTEALPAFEHSKQVNLGIAKLSPDSKRDQRSERLQREFGGPDTTTTRLAYFNNPGMAFRLLGDQHLANGKASEIAVQEAKTVADHALGLKQGNEPASGLDIKDLAMMRELGTIAAMVEDRSRSGDGKPMSKSDKTRLQQRVTTLDQHLAGIIQRDDHMSELRSAFNRDFAQLSKSPSVKTLRDSRAELRKVESELNQLTDFDKFHISTKVAIQRTPNISKGQEASDEIKDILGDDLVKGGDREARKHRMKQTVASLNASKLQKLMPNSSQRRERAQQLGRRRDQLRQTIDETQRTVLREARPMIEKYGQHGFDADPRFWERGGRGLSFPALQTHTKQAINYARTTLIPDLGQAMDEL